MASFLFSEGNRPVVQYLTDASTPVLGCQSNTPNVGIIILEDDLNRTD